MKAEQSNRSILVIDAAPEELRELRSSVAAVCPGWEFQFVSGSKAAEKILSKQRVDAVVASLNVKEPNALALFESLAKQNPDVLRIVLLSPEDWAKRERVGRLGQVFQQQLPRNCTGAALGGALGRGFLLQSWLSNERIRALISRIRLIPSIPVLYFELLEKIRSSTSSIREIADIIRQDAAITAKMLQLVNSPFFALSQPVANCLDAVMILGLERIRGLVLMVHFCACFEVGDRVPKFSIDRFWEHSLGTADLAVQIGRFEQESSEFLDETYTAGILHDIGKLALVSNDPARFGRILEKSENTNARLWSIEREELGASHDQVGGCLAGMWGLPLPIVEAIAFHHQPGQSENRRFSPLAAVHLADALENQCHAGDPGLKVVDEEFLARLDRPDLLKTWKNMVGLKTGG